MYPHSNPYNEQKLQQQRQLVAQLRQEASIKRINVSQAIEDIKKFVIENQSEDILLNGFNNVKQNPYFKKSSFSCELI